MKNKTRIRFEWRERYSVFKELDSGPHFQFGFEKLTAAFRGTGSPSHTTATNILLKRPSSGELLNAVSCWKLFGFNPVAASPWSCRVLSTLQSSAPPWWLTQPILWTSPSQVYYLLVALDVICFVPAMGISTSGLDLSLCVRLSTFQQLCVRV